MNKIQRVQEATSNGIHHLYENLHHVSHILFLLMLKELKEADHKLYIVHIYKYIHVFMCATDYSNNCYAHTHIRTHTVGCSWLG